MSDDQRPYDLEISVDDPNSGGYTIENVVTHRFNTYGPEDAQYHKIEATTAGGREHVVIVSSRRFISLSTDPGDDEPVADSIMAVAEAAGVDLPFVGDGHPGFIAPEPARPLAPLGENVRSLLGGLGERAAATRRTHDTEKEV